MIPPHSMQTTKKHGLKLSPASSCGRGIERCAGGGRSVTEPRQQVVLPSVLLLVLSLVLTACTPAGPKAVLEGKRLIEIGHYAQSVEELRTATRLMPTNAVAFNYLVLAVHQAGQSD